MRVNKLEEMKQRQLAENGGEAIEVITPVSPGTLPTLGLMQPMLANDLNKLKAVKKLEEKIRIKRMVLPEYIPFVANYVESGHDYPNDVAVQVMIWLFDVGDIEKALGLARYLIAKTKQVMPARFARHDLETFVCDAMYDWAKDLLHNDNGVSPYMDDLIVDMRTGEWDLHEAVESKIYVMQAKHKVRVGDDLQALALCIWAEKANPVGAGVKTLKKQIEARLESAKK